MYSDPGFLSLIVIFALWIGLVFLALGTSLRPRNWKKSAPKTKAKHAGILRD